MRYVAVASSIITGLLVAGAVAIAAPPGVINAYNALCDAAFPTRCATVNADGSVSVKPPAGTAGVTGVKATAADPAYVEGSDGNPMSSDLAGYLRVLSKQGSTPWIVSGAVTQGGAPWSVTGSGAAGTPATGVITAQGIAGGTPMPVVGAGTAGDGTGLAGELKTFSIGGLYNGASIDLWRSALGGANQPPGSSSGIGMVVPMGQCDDIAQVALTENNFGNARINCTDHSQLVSGSITASDNVTGADALKVFAIGGVFDGATWDAARGVVNGQNTAGVGIPSVGVLGQCDDTAPLAITENNWGNARINCTTHAQVVEALPSAAAAAGIAPVGAAALVSGTIVRSSPGNVYGMDISTTSVAGYFLLIDATAVPGSGAVVPVAHCYIPAFGTCGLNFNPPLRLATGVVGLFTSATTPYTYTPSATVAIHGQVQ